MGKNKRYNQNMSKIMRRKAMYQIKVNDILLPTIYWSLSEAMKACDYEVDRGYAVCCTIVPLHQ